MLTVAREHLNVELCTTALTALVRRLNLGIDARRALSSQQIATVGAW